ncbi:hypothetical protein SLE2022_189640 [Rubroshorea leprosula]
MVTGSSLTGPITDEHQVGNIQITDLHLIGNEIKAATPPASSRIRGGVAECQITDKAYVGNLSKKLHPPAAGGQLVGGGCIGSGNYREGERWKLIPNYR